MKQLSLIVAVSLLISVLAALDIDFDGEFRTRGAALYDDVSESFSNMIDSRFQLGLNGNIADNLTIRAAFEVGDFYWSDPWMNPLHVETNEAYIDYRMDAIKANIKIGKQYWADHRSLVLDDYFAGAMISIDEFSGFKTDLGLIKYPLGNNPSTWYMANVQTESPITIGVTGLIGYLDGVKLESVSALPYAAMTMGPLTVDVTPFFDYQYRNEEFGFGAAVKADASFGALEVGGDFLLATENGLTTISPWYQNGLYLYGIGSNHDGLNMYWNTPYQHNSDPFLSIVGKAKYQVMDKLKAFAAGGLLTDLGVEGNAGLEIQLIPEYLSAAVFGALGIHDSPDQIDMAFGAMIKTNF